eukprot:11628178-Karenia_brevis.AAC.1
MFRRPDEADSIRKTFILKESMATTNKWLQMVLNADRNGNETWEMYCFIHGYPARNVGSWLPGKDTPWCNNKRCASLAADVWPEMWKRGQGSVENWIMRKDLECDICKNERRRVQHHMHRRTKSGHAPLK